MNNYKLALGANFKNGEGYLRNIEGWRANNDPLLRADILRDWLSLLEDEYHISLRDMRYNIKGVRYEELVK